MSPVPLTYVGIHDEVGVALPDEDRRIVCKRGETKDFPDDLAGRAPTGFPGEEDYDPGEGLLAQVDNWREPGAEDPIYDGNVDEVLAHVGDDPERAAAALAYEREHKNRKTLVEQLEALTGDGQGA